MDCIAGFDAVDIFIFGWILFSFVWPVIAKIMKSKDAGAEDSAGSLSEEELEDLEDELEDLSPEDYAELAEDTSLPPEVQALFKRLQAAQSVPEPAQEVFFQPQERPVEPPPLKRKKRKRRNKTSVNTIKSVIVGQKEGRREMLRDAMILGAVMPRRDRQKF